MAVSPSWPDYPAGLANPEGYAAFSSFTHQAVTPIKCLRYTMSLPVSVCITGCDSLKILGQAIQAARSFKPLTEAQTAAILAKIAPVAMAGKYELYKTSQHFDSTAQHPSWLG